MKKLINYLFSAIALVSLASCASEIENPSVEVKGTHTVKFIAESVATKTTMDDSGSTVTFAWEESDLDNFHVFENGVEATTCIPELSDGILTIMAEFDGTSTPETATYTCFMAANVSSAGLPTLVVDESSDCQGSDNSYDSGFDILVARPIVYPTEEVDLYNLSLCFERPVAITKMTLLGILEGETLSDVTVTSDKPFVGDYNFVNSEWNKTGNSIEVMCMETVADGAVAVYFVSAPVEDATLTVHVTTENGLEYEKTFGTLSLPKSQVTYFGVNMSECQTPLFYESFNTNEGTGGNDGSWSGSIATSDISFDKEGWESENGSGANACVKVGGSTKKGSITTPALGLSNSPSTIKFIAAAWDGTDEVTKLNLSVVGNGVLNANQIDIEKAKFNNYSVVIAGADANTRVKISATTTSKNRFFIDEFKVCKGGVPFDYLVVSETEIPVAYDATTATINITASGSWTLSGPSAVTFSAASGSGNATVTVTFPSNAGNASPVDYAVSVVSGDFTETVTISQAGDESAGETATLESFSGISGKIGDYISYSTVKGSGTSNPVINSNCLRLYKPASGQSTGSELTLTAASGCTILGVTFTTKSNNTLKCVVSGETVSMTKSGSESPYTVSVSGLNTSSVKFYNTTSSTYDIVSVSVLYVLDPSAVTYSVTVTQPTEGGTISASDTQVSAGTEITLTATPATEYEFTSWTVVDSDKAPVEVTNNKFTMPAKNVTVSATFTKKTYAITKSATTNGSIKTCVNGTEVEVASKDDRVTLEATPADGYKCDGWSVTSEGSDVYVSNNSFTMPAAPVTVSATFSAVEVVTYDHAGTAADPYSVADVIKYVGTLGTATSENDVYVSGVISSITDFSTQYGNATYLIKDAGGEQTFTVYRGKFGENEAFTEANRIRVGDQVTVKGKVKEHNGTKEFDTGNYIVAINRAPYLEATASKTSNIAAAGETITVTVATNISDWQVTSSDNTNFAISNKTATGFDVVVAANSGTDDRSATITISAEGKEDITITLTQLKQSTGDAVGTVYLDENFATLTSWTSSFTSKTINGKTWKATGSVYEQNGCVKIGTSSGSTNNSITTPALSSMSDESCAVTLTFKAVSCDAAYTLSVIANNGGTVGTLTPGAITKNSAAINNTTSTATALATAFTAETATFSVTITNATPSTTFTIKTSSSSKRWYLDDVKVVKAY